MTRPRHARIATAAACAVVYGLAAGRAQSPIFRARTDVVSVPVSVTKGRQPVTGLGAADFAVSDNGVPQTVDAASLEHVPIDLTLLLTAFPANRTEEHDAGDVTAEAARQLLLPDDRLRIVWADNGVRGALAGADYTVGTDAVGREWTRGVALPNGVVFSNQPGTDSGFGVALADGLFYALAWPVPPERRHLIVALTDGWDTASTLDMSTVAALARHSDAVLHAVLWLTPTSGGASAGGLNILGSGRASPAWDESYRLLGDVVQQTGGTLQMVAQAPRALASIVADFRSSYVLRYTPRGVPLAGWHGLRVTVRSGSFTIRARKGYEGG